LEADGFFFLARLQMLAATPLTAEKQDYLNCIQISVQHMNTITSDIVAFANKDD
jgi:hypothetical protein